MSFKTLLKVLLISTLLIKISSIDPISVSKCNSNCDCLHESECKYAEQLLENSNGGAQLEYCSRFHNLVCCPRDEETSISEKKCMEFAEIKGFCPTGGLIKDGIVANPNEIPFMASVQVKIPGEKEDYKWICGGALIDPKFVITAAHCVDHFDTNVTVYVLLGAHYRNSSDKRLPVDIELHPEYNASNSFADIALLKLRSNANITTEKIRPACLSKTNGSEIETFMAAGWGYNGSQNEPDELLKTTLKQKPIENCRDLAMGSDTNSLICAAPNGSSGDVCEGDSGGPLFTGYPDRDNCLFAIMAVVSEGFLCDAQQSHTLHTSIFYFREWIEKTVWPEETNEKNP